MTFFTSIHCQSRKHCQACRGDPAFRRGLAACYGLTRDFACPFGVTEQSLQRDMAASPASSPPAPARWRGLGDVIASATKAVGIKPCGGCRKRQAKLNALVPFGPAAGREGPEPAQMTGSKV